MSEDDAPMRTSSGQMVAEALRAAGEATRTADSAMARANNAYDAGARHEDVCAERYRAIEAKLTEMKVETAAANARIWKLFAWIGGTGFMLLMSVLGFLLKTQFDTITEMTKASAQRAELRERIDAGPPQVIIQRAPGQTDMGATVERPQHQP